MTEASQNLPAGITYKNTPYQVCEGADALILMTEWNQYRALDFDKIKSLMKELLFIDLRNVYEPEALREIGFRYVGVGRT
jgi:UDPglucose 6-dehydrogenase